MLLILCVFVSFTTGSFVLSPDLLFLFSCFSVLFSIVITSLGEERELVYVVLVHLFVYFARFISVIFSLPLCVRDWLQLVIVALPVLFY